MRTLLWLLAVPLAILAATVLVAPLFLDEKALVALAAAKIEAESGVRLTVDGEASLSLFPRVALAMTEVHAELPDEGGHVQARSLATGVALLPLLGGTIEIGSLRLEGVILTTTASDGAAARAATADTSGLSDAELDRYYALRRQALDLGAARAAGSSLAIPLALEVGELALIDLRARTVDSSGQLISEVRLEELVASDLNIDGRPVPLTAVLSVPASDSGEAPLTVVLDGRFTADLDAKTLAIDELSARIGGATPKPVDITASGTVALTSMIADITLALRSDGLNGDGNIRYASFESPQIDATLRLSELTPALLVLAGPEAASAASGAHSAAAASESLPLPLHALRLIDTRAALTIDRAVLAEHVLSDVDARLRIVDGVATLDPVRAKVHGGDIGFKVVLDGHYNSAELTTEGSVTALDVSRVMAALDGGPGASGTANLSWKLRATGSSSGDLQRSLTGPVNFTTDDITVEGIGLERMVCQGVALVNRESLTAEFPADTRFRTLSADVRIADGVARLDPLIAQLAAASLTGKGHLDIASGDLRASLRAQLSPELGELDRACRINERYTKLRWPVECEGNLAGDPADWCTVDATEIIKDLAEGELKRKAEKEANKLLKKLFERG